MAHWLRYDLGISQRNEGADWYGNPYYELNTMPKIAVSSQALLLIQSKAIQQNNLKVSKELDIFNKTIDQINNLYHQETSNKNDFFSTFLKQLNKGFEFVSENIEKPKKSLQEITQYEQEICKFLVLISRYTNTVIPDNVFYEFQRMTSHLETDKNMYAFRARKAQLWEEISQWILSASGFSSYGIGRIIDLFGKQLVQDSVGFLENGAYPENSFIQIRITGKKNSTKENQDKLLNLLVEKNLEVSQNIDKKYNDYLTVNVSGLDISKIHNLLEQTSIKLQKNITIKIDENFTKQLENYFTVQAKSGNYQSLLNNSERDSIKASHLSEWSRYLSILINFATYRSNESLNKESKNLESYTNYIFSKNIAKTTLGKNNVFLSHYGFSTLDQYMLKNKFYFKLMPNPDTLEKLAAQSFQIGEQKI